MTAPVATGFAHVALFYRDAEEYASAVGDFVGDGVSSGTPVTVAVPEPNLTQLRSHLDPAVATEVEWIDMAVAGRNPGRIIPMVLLAAAARHPHSRVHIVGEPIWPGRDEVEYPACAAHEALINDAFAGRNATILCPYDVQGLDRTALADARRTHPILTQDSHSSLSQEYDDDAAASFNQPLPPPPSDAATLRYSLPADLGALRDFLRRQALGTWLDEQRVEELVIAVNELATNTVQHTGDAGEISVWVDTGVLVAQLHDSGRIEDPLAGRIPPTDPLTHGHGLLLVNAICDLVRVHTGEAGTTIRVRMALPAER